MWFSDVSIVAKATVCDGGVTIVSASKQHQFKVSNSTIFRNNIFY